MSHSVEITLIADQEIQLDGKWVNIYDIKSIVLDERGNVVGYHLRDGKKRNDLEERI